MIRDRLFLGESEMGVIAYPKLSLKAKGLYVLILAGALDEIKENFSQYKASEMLGYKIAVFRNAFTELIKAGVIDFERYAISKDKKGRDGVGCRLIVYQGLNKYKDEFYGLFG